MLAQIYKYVETDVGGKKFQVLHQSTTIPMLLPLEQGITAAVAQKAALPVVTIVKHILEEQMSCVDAIPEIKRQRGS